MKNILPVSDARGIPQFHQISILTFEFAHPPAEVLLEDPPL